MTPKHGTLLVGELFGNPNYGNYHPAVPSDSKTVLGRVLKGTEAVYPEGALVYFKRESGYEYVANLFLVHHEDVIGTEEA